MNARSAETDGMWRARWGQGWRSQRYVVSYGAKAVQNAVAMQTVEQIKGEMRIALLQLSFNLVLILEPTAICL
jgi:hypothetical protein